MYVILPINYTINLITDLPSIYALDGYEEAISGQDFDIESTLDESTDTIAYVLINGFKSDDGNDKSGSFEGATVINGTLGLYSYDRGDSDDISLTFTHSGDNNSTGYLLNSVVFSKEYIIPPFDQNYSIEYSFSNFLPEQSTHNTANQRIRKWTLSWSGLTDAEMLTITTIFNEIGGALRPFYLVDTDLGIKACLVSTGGSVSVSRDSAQLNSISFTAYQLENVKMSG